MNPSTADQGKTLRYLGRWQRLAGFLIEGIVWATIAGVAQAFEDPWETIAVIIITLAHTFYRAWMVNRYGGVLGHLAVQARIVDHKTGQRVTRNQAIARALMELLGFMIIPIIINMIMVMARRDRRHLYDLAAGTAVVQFNPELTEKQTSQNDSMQPIAADN